MFSILGGGSLGPEAPLVAICAALGGFVSRRIFKQRNRNVVRKHTLMGMAGALAAFFGSPLGGSLFALEVNSRFGVEYFEHTVEAIFCGEICLVVFRGLSRLPIQSIWEITEPKLSSASPVDVITGACIGLLGAGVAASFSSLHFKVMDLFGHCGLLDNSRAVYRALVGGSIVVLLGMVRKDFRIVAIDDIERIDLCLQFSFSLQILFFLLILIAHSPYDVLGRGGISDHFNNGSCGRADSYLADFWSHWI